MTTTAANTKPVLRDWKLGRKIAAATAIPAAVMATGLAPEAEAGGFYEYNGHIATTADGKLIQVKASVSFNDTVTANFTGSVGTEAVTSWSMSAGDDELSSFNGDQMNVIGFSFNNGFVNGWAMSAGYANAGWSLMGTFNQAANSQLDFYSGVTPQTQLWNDPGTWAGVSFGTQTLLPKTLGGSQPPVNPGPTANTSRPAVVADNFLCGCVPGSNTPNMHEGDPLNVATGNNFQVETDFAGGPATGLELRRYYNSQDGTTTPFGNGWRSTWHRSIDYPFGMLAALSPSGGSAAVLRVTRADGHVDTFHNTSGVWTSDADVTSTVTPVIVGGTQTGWKVTTGDDSAEYYNTAGQMTALADRAGNVTALAYDGSNRLSTVTGPFGHKLSFGYDANNRVATVTLPDGGVLNYGHDTVNNLASVTYADGKTKTYVYNESANTSGANLPMALTGIVDENNARFATFKYDTQGRAISSEHAGGQEKITLAFNANRSTTVTDARGNAHSYTFTNLFGVLKPTAVTGAPVSSAGGQAFGFDPATGFLTSQTDFNNNQTSFTRNAKGEETSRTEAAGTPLARTIATEWHQTFHLPTKITEPSGVAGVNRVTTLNWDAAKGTLTGKTVAAVNASTGAVQQSRTWSYTYNAAGQVLTEDGPRTDVVDKTTFGYSAANGGLLTSVTNALGQTTTIVNDADGRPKTITDANGLVTAITYTPRGQVASIKVGNELTAYGHDNAGNLTGITRPDGSTLAYGYNDAHQVMKITDAIGNHIDYTRDLAGNVTGEKVYDAGGNLKRAIAHAYDTVNRLKQDTGSFGQATVYDRDANGNVTGITDPNGFKTANTFDALNRLSTSVNPNQTATVNPTPGTTSVAYNPDDSVAQVTDPKGVATKYLYDGLGNQTQAQSKDGGTVTRAFDAAGNVKTSTDAKGQVTTNSYDALNRVTLQTFKNSAGTVTATNSFAYDQGTYGKGHLTSMTDPSGSTAWTFDQRGHEAQKKQNIKVGTATVTLTTANNWNAVTGKLDAVTLPSGKTLDFWRDQNGKVNTIMAEPVPVVGLVNYEPFGRPSDWVQGYGGQTYHYRLTDLDGNVSGIGFGNTGATTGEETIGLTLDPGNRVTQIADNTVQAKFFNYDRVDEVTHYTGSGVTRTWDADANGNRTQFTSTAATTSTANYTIDPASNRLVNRNVDNKTITNYTTDANGSITSDGTRNFTFNAAGQLSRATNGTAVADYAYNGLGERVKKTVNGVTTLFAQAGTEIVGEYDGAGLAKQENVYLNPGSGPGQAMPVAMFKSGTTYYVNPDHLGAPRTITTTAGAPVWTWDKDPFGLGTVWGSGAFVNNLRFPGQYYDSETGLFHNNARDYDPSLGRYIQSDPIGLNGGMNPYVYVNGNPVNNVDPKGLDLEHVFESMKGTNEYVEISSGIFKGLLSHKDPCDHEVLWSITQSGELAEMGASSVKYLAEYAYNSLKNAPQESNSFPTPEEWRKTESDRADQALQTGKGSSMPGSYDAALREYNQRRLDQAFRNGKSYFPMPRLPDPR